MSAESGIPNDVQATARRSLGWQSGATIVVSVLQTFVTLAVAAAVSPDEFALLGVALIVFNAQYLLVGGLGLGAALIHWSDTKRIRDAIDSGFTLTAGIGLTLALFVATAAPLIASLFSEGFSQRSVIAVVRLMSVFLFVVALTEIPQALLEKNFQFRRRAIAETTAVGMYFLTTFLLLILGSGIWSVLFGRLVQGGIFLTLLLTFMPVRFRFPPHLHRDVIREMIRFGKFIGFSAILIFLMMNFDTFLVGSQIGAVALGSYALAFTITNIAPTFLSTTLGRVWFPLYVKLNTDRGLTRLAAANALHLVLALMFPVTVALVAFVPGVLDEIFGSEWNEAASVVRVLAFYGLARALASMLSTLFMGQGYPQAALRATVLALVLSVGLAIPLLRFDAVGVAAAFTVGQVAAALFLTIKGRAYLPSLSQIPGRGALVAAMIATLVAFAVGWIASAGAGVVQLVVFAVSYLTALTVFDVRVRHAALSARAYVFRTARAS